jgi:hypothetical protein
MERKIIIFSFIFVLTFVSTFAYNSFTSETDAFGLTGEKQCKNPVYFRWGGKITYNHKTGTSQAMRNWHSAQKKRKFVGSNSAKGGIDSYYSETDGFNGYEQWWFDSKKCITKWTVKLNRFNTKTYSKSVKVGGHELGHILGLSDRNDSKVLMYMYTPKVSYPTSDEKKEFVLSTEIKRKEKGI